METRAGSQRNTLGSCSFACLSPFGAHSPFCDYDSPLSFFFASLIIPPPLTIFSITFAETAHCSNIHLFLHLIHTHCTRIVSGTRIPFTRPRQPTTAGPSRDEWVAIDGRSVCVGTKLTSRRRPFLLAGWQPSKPKDSSEFAVLGHRADLEEFRGARLSSPALMSIDRFPMGRWQSTPMSSHPSSILAHRSAFPSRFRINRPSNSTCHLRTQPRLARRTPSIRPFLQTSRWTIRNRL